MMVLLPTTFASMKIFRQHNKGDQIMKKKKRKVAPQKMRQEGLMLFYGIIILAFVILLGRLLYWNLSKGHEFEKKVLVQQRHSSTKIPYERGKIYDSLGKVLATNERYYTLILEPKNILIMEDGENGEKKYKKNKDATLDALETYMGLDQDEVMSVLLENKDSYYLEYQTDLSYDDIADMKAFMAKASEKKAEAKSEKEKKLIEQAELITGVYFVENYRRVYPNDDVGCHVIGFTSSGNKGQWGLEKYYNDELNGVNGRTYVYLDEDRTSETTTREPEDGNSIVTTINLDIQKAIDKRRKEFDSEVGSKMTTITVMDPNSGEILGMTSSYDYDLNDPDDGDVLKQFYNMEEIKKFAENQDKVNKGEELEREKPGEILTTNDAFSSIWKNSVLTDTFEPGSTFKPFTVATALEEDLYEGTEGFSCPGYLVVNNTKIACSHTHGNLEFKDVIAQSCNVALMTMGLREGKEIFTAYQKLFGFGQKTGIDLPGEADTSNLLYPEEKMQNVDLATNSFGQNFNVTTIQMISSFCSLINGGYYYEPHVVKQIKGADGNAIKNVGKTLKKMTISKETSDKMKPLLEETVLTGTGKKAAIKGYSIGGKTGTAEKITEVQKNGKTVYVRNKKDYLVSFIAFTPVEDPQVVIYVTIDEPNVDYQANSGLAVDLERKCMKDIIKILGIKKTKKE